MPKHSSMAAPEAEFGEPKEPIQDPTAAQVAAASEPDAPAPKSVATAEYRGGFARYVGQSFAVVPPQTAKGPHVRYFCHVPAKPDFTPLFVEAVDPSEAVRVYLLAARVRATENVTVHAEAV